MPSWLPSFLSSFLNRRVTAAPGDCMSDPRSAVRWISAADNPFGVDILDCRVFSESMIAVTGDPAVAQSYMTLRGASGEDHRGHTPADSKTCECDLRYTRNESPPDGPIFKAQSMEDKWDIYFLGGYLYFARSWTGDLGYRAKVVFRDDCTNVTAIDAPTALFDPDPSYPIAAVDFLIRSHLYRLPVPHPLPKSLSQNPAELAVYSFGQFGRYARFGTFADTTQVRLPAEKKTE